MATNQDGHLVDDKGNVVVDFVWGNFPLQPNDDRGENTLDPALDNHSIATTGWGGYPGFVPNSEGGPAATSVEDLLTFYEATLNTEAIASSQGSYVATIDEAHPYLFLVSDQSGSNNTYWYSGSSVLDMFPPARDMSSWTQDSPTTWHTPGMGADWTMELLPTGGWAFGMIGTNWETYQRCWQVDPATNLVIPFTAP